jgi:hypothetical protein
VSQFEGAGVKLKGTGFSPYVQPAQNERGFSACGKGACGGRFESAAEFALLPGKKLFYKILVFNNLKNLALQNLDSKTVTLKILQSKDLRSEYLR